LGKGNHQKARLNPAQNRLGRGVLKKIKFVNGAREIEIGIGVEAFDEAFALMMQVAFDGELVFGFGAGLRLPLSTLPAEVNRRAFTAEVVEAQLHVFLPPLLQGPFLALLEAVAATARELGFATPHLAGSSRKRLGRPSPSSRSISRTARLIQLARHPICRR